MRSKLLKYNSLDSILDAADITQHPVAYMKQAVDSRASDVPVRVPDRVANVDGLGQAVSIVSGGYKAVQLRDIVGAANDHLSALGHSAEFKNGWYRGGKQWLRFMLPDSQYTVPGDPSPIVPGFQIENSSTGTSGTRFRGLEERTLCTNLLVSVVYGEVSESRIHRGGWTIDGFVGPVLADLVAGIVKGKAEIERLLATPTERLFKGPGELPRELVAERLESDKNDVEALLADCTNDRYRLDVARREYRYRKELGENAWATINAITEEASHGRMEHRSPAAAQTWQLRACDVVRTDGHPTLMHH